MYLNSHGIETIVKLLQNEFSPYCILLIGSAAKGELTSESDVDIVFMSDKSHRPYQLYTVAQDLAIKLGRDVDLIDFHQASTVFQAQIVSTRKIIYCNDPNRKAQDFMLAYKKYAKLNEERQIILDAIKESGEIYDF